MGNWWTDWPMVLMEICTTSKKQPSTKRSARSKATRKEWRRKKNPNRKKVPLNTLRIWNPTKNPKAWKRIWKISSTLVTVSGVEPKATATRVRTTTTTTTKTTIVNKAT